MSRRLFPYAAALWLALGCGLPAQATILTFEIFNPGLVEYDPVTGDPIVDNFNNPAVLPFYSTSYGYPEGYRIDDAAYYNTAVNGYYGSRVGATEVDADGGVKFLYGEGGEGFTEHISVFYGPYSIFTGGPTLWREGYNDLDGVLRQSSQFGVPPIGYDYNILDIVFVADPGWDVVLHSFDLGSAVFAVGNDGTLDRTVGAIEAYDGVPFPFITPDNLLFDPPLTNVAVDYSDTAHTEITFASLQSPIIWLRLNMNNLGPDSEFVAIDNIRFSQIRSANEGDFDPAEIDAAFQEFEASQTAAVPEPASLFVWLVGAMFAATVHTRRTRIAASV